MSRCEIRKALVQHSLSPYSLSIVIPVYNEIQSIHNVFQEVLSIAEQRGWQVIAVNDGSVDGSGEALNELAGQHSGVMRVIHHTSNRGYGAALKSGIRSINTDLVATMDSDGQHTIAMLDALLKSAQISEMVVGQRREILHSSLWRMPGKWFLVLLASYLSQQSIPDLNSGLRIFHIAVIRRYLHLFPNGFSFSTTSTLILINRGYNVRYIPIDIRARTGKSTVTLRTGFDTLVLILRLIMLLAPLRIFLPISIVSVIIGITWAIPYLLDRRGLTVVSLLLILNGVVIFLVGLLADQVAELRKERFEEIP
jgi:glycosyltransferase involved in cell wall biosynthesis